MSEVLVNLHLVSDATGETLNAITRATVVQFEHANILYHRWSLIRTRLQLHRVLEGLEAEPGPVLSTLVDRALRAELETACERLALPVVNVLDPVLAILTEYVGEQAGTRPGRQYRLDADYFRRIDAMHYVLAHDDGQATAGIAEADVVLVGVSRSSKTPTSFYLANRGVKAANVPLVPNLPLPAVLEEALCPVIGLTVETERLIEIRRQRLRAIAAPGRSVATNTQSGEYVDQEAVAAELLWARRICNTPGPQSSNEGRMGLQRDAPALVLASGSITRAALLAAAGLRFSILVPAFDERPPREAAERTGRGAGETALLLAEGKARAVSETMPAGVVVGADQILACDHQWFEKPTNRAEAAEQLRALRGRVHRLATAVACASAARNFSEEVLQSVLDADTTVIGSSVGGYRLEGPGVQLCKAIEGDHFTILGLPLLPLLGFLRECGVLVD
jgi:[pyruvate, water dikinase]-phosphate phosphotransferase / [pyruvate, water dikinase] kinase